MSSKAILGAWMLAGAVGCGSANEGADPGFETGACIAGACRGGLVCLSDFCVVPAGMDGSDGVDTGDGGGSTMPGITSAAPTGADGQNDDGESTVTPPGDDGPMGSSDGGVGEGSSDGADCNPPCPDGERCIAGTCFGSDSSGGDSGGCPAGEMCLLTGGGGMACLGASTHCVLPCAAGSCPSPLVCDAGGACSYVTANPPGVPHPDWPLPDGSGMCPAGHVAGSFEAGTAVCVPECAAAAPQCPTGGICALNPTSSGTPC